MRKIKFKINFCFTSEILEFRFKLSNENDTELKPHDKPGDLCNKPGEDDDTGRPNGDPGKYDDDDPDGLKWPPINYN